MELQKSLYRWCNEKITRTIDIPLYYAGLKDKAVFRGLKGASKTLPVLRDYNSKLSFTLEPESYTWYTVE